LAKKKFILKSVGSCKSCNIEIINTDSFVIFADRTCQHTKCYEQSETIRQDNIKKNATVNIDGDKRMEMYIEYLKTKKCRHKYANEKR
jgi:uncharacterized protein (DUF1684 family)